MRNQVLVEKFKENIGSIAGQPVLGEKLRRTASCKHREAGRNTLFEGEQDAQQSSVMRTEASFEGGEE